MRNYGKLSTIYTGKVSLSQLVIPSQTLCSALLSVTLTGNAMVCCSMQVGLSIHFCCWGIYNDLMLHLNHNKNFIAKTIDSLVEW